MEYVLTNGNVIAEKALRDRLITPFVEMASHHDDCENIIETLHRNDMGKNFKIAKKVLTDGKTRGRLESMAFLIHFLGKMESLVFWKGKSGSVDV